MKLVEGHHDVEIKLGAAVREAKQKTKSQYPEADEKISKFCDSVSREGRSLGKAYRDCVIVYHDFRNVKKNCCPRN